MIIYKINTYKIKEVTKLVFSINKKFGYDPTNYFKSKEMNIAKTLNILNKSNNSDLFSNTINDIIDKQKQNLEASSYLNNNKSINYFFYDKDTRIKRLDNLELLKQKKNIVSSKGEIDIPSLIYQSFFEIGMLGDIKQLKTNNCYLSLISTVYSKINISNIYKTLNITNPNFIFLQFRPDLIFNNMSVQINYFLRNKITENKYFENIVFTANDVIPSYFNYIDVFNKIKKDKLINIKSKKDIIKQIESIPKNLKSPELSERLSKDVLSICSLWSLLNNNCKLILGDIPLCVLIKKIINKCSLYEIKDIFENTFKSLPQLPDLEPNNPLTISQYLYPEIFVKPSDEYMSEIVKIIFNSNLKKDKLDISAFVGYGQTLSLPLYIGNFNNIVDNNTNTLINNNVDNKLKQIIDPGLRHKTLIYGKDSLDIVADKISMLLLLFYGLNFPFKPNIYNYYLDWYIEEEIKDTGLNNYEFLYKRMEFLLINLIKEKKTIAINNISNGVNLKKEMFMRETIENYNI